MKMGRWYLLGEALIKLSDKHGTHLLRKVGYACREHAYNMSKKAIGKQLRNRKDKEYWR